jgi:hypothetical protein
VSYIQPTSSGQPSENHHILLPHPVFEKFNFWALSQSIVQEQTFIFVMLFRPH